MWFRLKGSASSCLPSQEPADWFEHHVVPSSVGDSRKVAGILLYFWWNVWKERNKYIFDSVQNSELHVACTAKDDIDIFFQASSS
jgi:hypothetical protein